MTNDNKYDYIIYVEEYGDDKNTGLTHVDPVKTLRRAYDIQFKEIKDDEKKIMIKLGKGKFVIDKAYPYGNSVDDAGYVIMNNSTIRGEGLSTKIIINASDTQGLIYAGRQYYIKQYKSSCILCDVVIELNAKEYSGQYENALFVWCDGLVSNVVFIIDTQNMSYGYYNNGSQNCPTVKNCMFLGQYDISSDYTGSPYYGDSVFIKQPTNYSQFNNNISISDEDNRKLYDMFKNTPNTIKVQDLKFKNNIGVLSGVFPWTLQYFIMKQGNNMYMVKDKFLTKIDMSTDLNAIKDVNNQPNDFLQFIKDKKFNMIMIE